MIASILFHRAFLVGCLGLLFFTGACSEEATPPKNEVRREPATNPVQEKTPESNADNSQQTKAFKSGLELHGIRFLVESPNTLAGNRITVVPSGLKISNDPFTSPAGGEVIDAQIGDLNVDQSPEVYVFVREHGGLGKVSVIAYATNARKSMSEFVLPEPDTGTKEYSGYYGNDKFEVVENTLARQFPLFESKNGMMTKTGKTRVIQYKIKPGEATWQFYVHRFDDF